MLLGDDGNGGSEVIVGEAGSLSGRDPTSPSLSSSRPILCVLPKRCLGSGLRGDGDLLSGSVGEVIVLLTGEAVFGVATDSVRGMAMKPVFAINRQYHSSICCGLVSGIAASTLSLGSRSLRSPLPSIYLL